MATVAPLKPPLSWFRTPEPDAPLPLTVTKEGRVFGHLALWDTCHSGMLNGNFSECVKAPRSASNYDYFHLGALETSEGEDVTVGKVTFDTGHAPLGVNLRAAARHYDDTGSVGAFVRAVDGTHGPWLSGVLRSDVPPEGIRDLKANPPSGDWRGLGNGLELVAALSVPVPGFPIPRAQFALAASASGEVSVSALILPGFSEDDLVPARSREFLRRRQALNSAFAQ